ncbi:hypothetical protein GQ607_002491, partial [Colletotrichum asianum]
AVPLLPNILNKPTKATALLRPRAPEDTALPRPASSPTTLPAPRWATRKAPTRLRASTPRDNILQDNTPRALTALKRSTVPRAALDTRRRAATTKTTEAAAAVAASWLVCWCHSRLRPTDLLSIPNRCDQT